MIRTRVGYAGGTTLAPTYRSIGDHTETLQLDFDPSVISYGELLDEFLASHNACRAPFSTQYRSAIFVHDDDQRAQAEAKLRAFESERNDKAATSVEGYGGFTLAEDYHQKYRLRRDRALAAELEERYPELQDFVDSPTVTRANAFVAGYGDEGLRSRDLPRMGLTYVSQRRLSN